MSSEAFLQSLYENLSTVSDAIWRWFELHGVNILVILVIVWVIRKFGAHFTMNFIKRTVRHDLYPTEVDRKKRIATLGSLVDAVFRAGTLILAVMLIITELKPSYTTAIFTSAGLIGIAIGFGAQSLIRDFMSGIFIIFENQYRIGDTVTLDQVSGKVEAITIRTTIIRDINGYVHHVPNGSIVVTTNKTLDYAGINEEIVVHPNTNLEKLEDVINKTGAEISAMETFANLIQDPPHFQRVMHVDGNGVTVQILGKTSLKRQFEIKGAFMKALIKNLDKAKIQLATPIAATAAAKKKK